VIHTPTRWVLFRLYDGRLERRLRESQYPGLHMYDGQAKESSKAFPVPEWQRA
jgi:hypothetical protein